MKKLLCVMLGLLVLDGSASGAEETLKASDNVWVLELKDLLPGRLRQPLQLHLNRSKDVWRGVAVAPTWNQVGHEVNPSGLTLENGNLKGSVDVICHADGYVPGGGQPLLCKLRLEVSAGADSQVRGAYEGQCGTENVKGTVTGTLRPLPADKANGALRLDLSSAVYGRMILWAQAQDGKLDKGYVFESQTDAPADVSKLELREDSISGEFSYAVDSPVTPRRMVKLSGGRVGGMLTGTVEEGEGKKAYSGGFWATLGKTTDDPSRKFKQLTDEAVQGIGVGLPSGYEDPENKDKRYPVMYGFGVGPGGVGNVSKVPFIQCSAAKAIGEYGLDAVIDHMDRTYRTIAAPNGRAVMGYSAGAHIAFRHLDRVDKIGAFVIASHPLRAASWTKQKDLERQAIVRGLEGILKLRPAIIFLAGTEEACQRRGCLMQRDLLRDEFGIPCAYREAPKGKHQSPRHTQYYGAWVYEWINDSFQQMAKTGQGLLPPEMVPVENPPVLTKPLRVKFHPAESSGVEGWRSDTGKLFGPREDGFHYGWHYDCSHNFAQTTNENVEAIYRTFYRMPDQRQWGVPGRWDEIYRTPHRPPDQKEAGSGRYARVPKAMLWEVAVPNGMYRVHLQGGDPDFKAADGKTSGNPFCTGPAYLVEVEGIDAVPPAQAIPERPGATFDVSVTVEVKDGRLTINNEPLAGQICLSAVEVVSIPGPGK